MGCGEETSSQIEALDIKFYFLREIGQKLWKNPYIAKERVASITNFQYPAFGGT